MAAEADDCREAVVSRFAFAGSSPTLGPVKVRVLDRRDVGVVAPLLAEAGLLSEAQGREWAKAAVGSFPEAACLVGELEDGVAVGVVGLSFGLASRQQFTSLVPPDNVAYLSELAVSSGARRAGVATALMDAAEAFSCMMGFESLYLHCRYSDKGAFDLYAKRGYVVSKSDPALLPRRRALKFKTLDAHQALDARRSNGTALEGFAREARGMPKLSSVKNVADGAQGARASIVLEAMTGEEEEEEEEEQWGTRGKGGGGEGGGEKSAVPRTRGDLLQGSDLLLDANDVGVNVPGVDGKRPAHARSEREAEEALILTATFVGLPLLLSALLNLVP